MWWLNSQIHAGVSRLGQQRPLPSDPSSSQPPSSSLHSSRESTDMHSSLTCALWGCFSHERFFFMTVTIMERKATQALFCIHSSMWVTFGFWLISAYLMCRIGFFSKQFHYLAVLVTLKTNWTIIKLWPGDWANGAGILLFCFILSLTHSCVSNLIEFSEKNDLSTEIRSKNKLL